MRAVVALHAAIGLLLVANLIRMPVAAVGLKDAPIFLNDILIGLVICVGAIVAAQRRRLQLDAVALTALAFATVGGVSAALAIPRFELTAFQFAFSIAYLLRWMAYFAIYVFIVNFVRRDDVGPLLRTFGGMVLIFSAFGIVQAIFLPGFAQIVYPESTVNVDWDYQGHRLVSTFLDPNLAGALIAIGLLLLLARMAYGVPTPIWQPLLLFAALILTVSRSSVLALLVGGAVILLVKGMSKRMMQFAAVLALVSIPALPAIIDFAVSYQKLAVDMSAMTRVVAWLRAAEVFADHPIIGVGFNTFGFALETYGHEIGGKFAFALDGGLIFIAVLTGVLGLTVYLAMLALVLVRGRQVYRSAARPPEARALALGVTAGTVALLVHSLFVNSLLFPFLMQTMWFLWGLVFVVARPEEPAAEPEALAVRIAPAQVVALRG